MQTDLKQSNIMDLFEFKVMVESGEHPRYIDRERVDV
jgi:hypothetical protein